MDVDDMLSHAGDFGRYQIFLMALFCIINVLSAFHYFSQTIISVVPEHRCRDADPLMSLQEAEINTSVGNCVSGWDYNLTHGFQSIISEASYFTICFCQQFDWVGDDNWKPALGQSLFFVGSVIGTLGLGVMADLIGRLPVLVLANLLALVGNLATAFTSGLPQFASCRLLAGLATDSNFLMMYILVMEYMRPNMRTLGLNLCIGVFYSLGCVVVPWVAVLTMDWRHFLLVVSTPLVVVPAYYLLVPESARWLINKGRTDEAVTCFLRIAKFNGRNIPTSVIDTFKTVHSTRKVSDKSPTLLGLFATPRLRRKTCILIFKSLIVYPDATPLLLSIVPRVVLTVCYDAISRNVNDVGYSPFVMFSVSSATILPSCLVILFLQDRVGRKGMASVSLLSTGLFTAASGIILACRKSNMLLTASLAIVGRFGVNIAYNSGAQYAAELIPTEVRGQGVAAIHVAGYAATFFSPYILYMATFWRPIPELLLGILSVMGAIVCLLLPETMDKSLPRTLQDGETFGEGEGIWDFAFLKKRKLTELPEVYRKLPD
uniref:Major facilitator superfamily (MFS) profile domain-containing protein n=1 Tax=Timema cristinae TaxID=61476 RepID=A0A7R9CHR8_TIMCR|nr:unnamed protein product [Timema cristinae]